MRKNQSFLALIMLFFCMLLSACGITDTALANTDPPMRVTPFDTSADELVATIQINEDQDATDRLSVITLQMGIDAIAEDNYAHFYHGEYVVCNGVRIMMGDTPQYTFKIDPSGYTCSYRGFKPGTGLLGAVNMIDLALRSRLHPQALSFSSQGYALHYTPDSGNLACPITAVASDSSGKTINGGSSSSVNGVYYGPNTSSLTGAGEIKLIRTCSWKFEDDFSMVNLTYRSTASIEVTWSH